MGSTTNLVAGLGTLYTAAVGEALPEIDALTPPAITVTPAGTWSGIGYTIENFEINLEVESELDYINESNVPVKQVVVREGGTLKFKFKERDFTALDLAVATAALTSVVAGASQTAQDILKFGDGTAVEKALLYLHESPEEGSRLWHIPKAFATGGLALPHGKKSEPFDVEFTMLGDMTQTAGERLLVAYDITAAASS